MTAFRRIQIPNLVVYAAVYAILFGVSIWLLTAHKDTPNKWFLYVGMIWAVLAGLVKFILYSRKKSA